MSFYEVSYSFGHIQQLSFEQTKKFLRSEYLTNFMETKDLDKISSIWYNNMNLK